MAKKRTRKPAPPRPPSTPSTPSTPPTPSTPSTPPTVAASPKSATPKPVLVEPPAFWFGCEITWAKLLVVRVVMFALLAVDALLQISHAPRYGAGGFNVAQLPGLDTFGPGRVSYEVGQLIVAYLCVLAACGVATRIVVPVTAAIYAWLYVGSQLDSYQHHYLVALLFVLLACVPWQRPPDATPSTPIRAWALRLVLVQIGIVYLWAAISKMHPAWLDGRTLSGQITAGLRSTIESTIGFEGAAWLTLLAELVLAFAVWIRPAWIVALPLGVAFHLGILASGLEIGLFAYLMLGLYLLLTPDRVWVALASLPPVRVLGAATRRLGDVRGATGWLVTAAASGLAFVLAWQVRFEHALVVFAVLTAVPAVLTLVTRRSVGPAHLLAVLVWLLVDLRSSTAVDYYRFWGGSSRRLGDPVVSEHAYRRLTEVAPDEPAGHYQLGRLLLARGDEAAGLAALHEAQRLEPLRARAWVAEARYLVAKGRTAEAIEKAREATYSEPSHAEARSLLDSFTGAKAPPSAPTTTVDDAP